ncbi:MAG: FtsQ-type POTRA domain-containing protein [Firmicutes bacterium]|nr:FtsQ-type POTRA domain-containing protein [Bacillota bacterium]
MSARRIPLHRPVEKRPKRNVWRAWKSFLLVVLLAEVALAMWTSPAFSVKQVTVDGINLTLPEQVMRKSHIRRGSSWVFLSPSRIAQRLQELPTVAEAVVSRGLPGRVYIRVFERQPVALLTAAGSSSWIDARGVPFWKTNRAGQLPEIRVEMPLTITLGRPVQNKPVQTALEILYRYVPEYQLPVTQIVVDREGNLCLNMKRGLPQVKIGDSVALPQKMLRTAELWTQPQIVQQAEYLDVSCVDKPVWKPRARGKGAL